MSVFTNPQGLHAMGENLFEVSNNSGMPNTGAANEAGRGKIVAGTLEMSNVDLSDQFVDMIVTQRGFQANSRSITTADQMLQELLGLKR
jgi:flagellar hook protein FlgE